MQPDFDSVDVFDLLRNLDFRELKAEFAPYSLEFIKPAKTSRNTLHRRDIFVLKVYEEGNPEVFGLGEVAPLDGLSIESADDIENALIDLCVGINNYEELLTGKLDHAPSVVFALEQAMLDLRKGGQRVLFPSKFTEGNEVININGLIWMGSGDYMIEQINDKVQEGFACLKLKIGSLGIENELKIIEQIREVYGYNNLELRLDANGAFNFREAQMILDQLSQYDIHSIEQPIASGNWEDMNELCRMSPIPIALDEECIGAISRDQKEEILESIYPSYIILKPSLLGGLQQCEEWIELASQLDVGWWITSTLESNLGLNAIAQWTFTKQNPMHQGLGTGQLFKNNFDSPLYIKGEHLMYDPARFWKIQY